MAHCDLNDSPNPRAWKRRTYKQPRILGNNLGNLHVTLASNNSEACNLLTRPASLFAVVIAKLIVSRRLYSDVTKLAKRLRRGRFAGRMIYRLNFKRDSLQPPNQPPSNRLQVAVLIPWIKKKKERKREKIEEKKSFPSPLVALYFNRQRSFL